MTMTNTTIQSNVVKDKKDEGVKEDDNVEECCCDNIEAARPVVSPTIEDFISIIEDSEVLEDRNLSLQLILLVDMFIDMHLYNKCNISKQIKS